MPHIKRASAFEQLRNLAVSRIYLDNIDHLTAYWVSLGLPLAQVSLSYGVDDLHGTILEEKIFHMAGATTPQQQTIAALEHAIREAGREPVQRDSHYRHISHRSDGTHADASVCRACVRVALPVIPSEIEDVVCNTERSWSSQNRPTNIDLR